MGTIPICCFSSIWLGQSSANLKNQDELARGSFPTNPPRAADYPFLHVPSFVQRLKLSLVRICGVRIFLGEVEALRGQRYSEEDEEHERMLLEVSVVASCRSVEMLARQNSSNSILSSHSLPLHTAVVSIDARLPLRIPGHQAVAGPRFPG